MAIARCRLMIRAIGLALSDLCSRQILTIMLQALIISLLIFAIIAGLLVWLLAGADPCAFLGISSCPLDVGGGTIGAIGLTLLSAWFLFPAVAIAVMTTFSDRIAGAVERRHYPEAASDARRIGLVSGLLLGLKSAGRLALFNFLALPFYILLMVTGAGPFILFVIVNGFAFGHDVAELAAVRHASPATRRTWLKDTRGPQRQIGVVVSILFLLPLVNLFAPVIATAAGIHLFNLSFWEKFALERSRGATPLLVNSRSHSPR